VYQSYRQGPNAGGSTGGFTYTLSGLDIGVGYKLRLHFADDTSTHAGQRVFAIYVNGAVQEQSFDIWSLAGGTGVAYIQEYEGVNAEVGGNIIITCQNGGADAGAGSACLSGIELIPPAQTTNGTQYMINCGGPAVGPSPSTTLNGGVSAGANNITVHSTTGMAAGVQLQVDDFSPTTTAEVLTIDHLVGSQAFFTSNLGYNHANGANVYVLPTVQARYGWSAVQQIYGVQSVTINDPLLQTLSQCQTRAQYEVNRSAWQRWPSTLVTASMPTIKPGWLIKWFNGRAGANGSDFWGYVQSVERVTERTSPTEGVDEDTYGVFILYVQAR
jgi:hypothetical protein